MTAPSDSNGNSQHLSADPLRRVVVRKRGERNCASCGKPMPLEHHLSKWHFSCKMALPGYKAGYSDGRRSMEPPKRQRPRALPGLAVAMRPAATVPHSLVSDLNDSQRREIARKVIEKDKAELERELAEKKVRLEFLEREKAAADCHARMLKAGFELPEFRFHPDVETIHAEQQEVAR